jgi:hypothetical protein
LQIFYTLIRSKKGVPFISFKRFTHTFALGLCIFACSQTATLCSDPWQIEGKAGAFLPNNRRVSKIFHNEFPFFEVEVGYRPNFSAWNTWGSVGCIFAEGDSLGCENRTTLQITTLAIGADRFFPISDETDFFVGLAAVWGLYTNTDHSPYLHQDITTNAPGYIARAGISHFFSDTLAFRFFAEYLDIRFRFHRVYSSHFTYRNNLNMGGFKIGAGLLYDF